MGPYPAIDYSVTKRTVRLLPLSTAVLRGGGFPGASEGALSPWHGSRTLWSFELNQQNGQTDQAKFTAHTKHISPELDLSSPAKRTISSSYPPSKRLLTLAQLQDNARCSLASPLRQAGQPNKMPQSKNVSQRRSHAPKWVCTYSCELFLLWQLLNEIPVISDPPRPPPCRTNVCYRHPSIYCSGTSLQQKRTLCTIGTSNESLSQQLILELGVTGGDASKVGYYVGFIVCELAPFIRCTS